MMKLQIKLQFKYDGVLYNWYKNYLLHYAVLILSDVKLIFDIRKLL
jgi:hypothetical protein